MAERNKTFRSKKIRAKREKNKKQPSARKPRTSQGISQYMPPVLMRSNMAQPKQKKRSRTPKRRFDIALSSPGVEIRLPAIPRVNLGWRLLSAILAVGLFILLYHLWTSPLYQVQAAEVKGTQYLEHERINQVLNLYNKPIFLVDPQRMKADLKRAFPGLMVDSSVQIILPASVIVTVQERVPVIAWEQGGETLWVDEDGISFEPAGENDTLVKVSASAAPQAPIMIEDDQAVSEEELDPLDEILEPVALMTPKMATAVVTMEEFAPQKGSLTYDPRHGLGWFDTKRGWDVYFGMDVSNIQEKLTVYKAIKNQLKDDGISPVLISVEHVHAPYYRLEP